ncbi:DUF4430 domain-containing protein [Caldifermentibacillus hisashii]|uniref:DUF4430 domain-containing protein n=1 Tax=Caldifermentibacillus hisashii TaxID=996558 RepID=A0ABU9K2G9_9BACI
MKLCKKALFILLSAFILLFAVGCQKDSALPENETLSEKTTLEKPSKEEHEMKGNKENGSTEEGNSENSPKENETKANTENKQSNPNTDKATENTGNKQENTNTNTANKSNTQTSKSVENKGATPAPKTESGQPVNGGGQTSAPAPAPKPKKDTVTVSVDGYQGPINAPIPTVFLSPTEVEIESGYTALDATLKILKDKKIQISVRGSGATAYVEGINNIYEFDYGPLSGWLIEVNDVLIDNSAGIEPIKNGDKIEWIYTLDYTKDTTY